MKTIVVHNSAGRVISVARLESPKRGRPKLGVGIMPRRGQSVLELDTKGALARARLGDIYEQFQVDVKAKRLKKKSGSRQRQRRGDRTRGRAGYTAR